MHTTKNIFLQKRSNFSQKLSQRETLTSENRKRKIIAKEDSQKTKIDDRKKEKIIESKENVYTIPNLLSIIRILTSPFLGYVILQQNYVTALKLWLFASITDFFDGWIARRWSSQASKIGSYLDPIADKVLVGTLFITLTQQGLIPLSLTCLIVIRDVILIAAGFIIRYNSLSPPRTLKRYFDLRQVTEQLTPTYISKINTVIQLLLVGSTLAAPIVGYINHSVLQNLWIITALSTFASFLSYVFLKKTITY